MMGELDVHEEQQCPNVARARHGTKKLPVGGIVQTGDGAEIAVQRS